MKSNILLRLISNKNINTINYLGTTYNLFRHNSVNKKFFSKFSILNHKEDIVKLYHQNDNSFNLEYLKRKFSTGIQNQATSKGDKSDNEIQIREAQKTDIEELENLFFIVCKKTFTKEVLEKFKIEDFQSSIENEKIFIAEKDNTIVGFISFFSGTYSFIHNLFIHPNWQNKGVGKQLLKKVMQELQPPIELEVLTHNTKACTFFETHGWKKVSLQENTTDPYFVYRYDEMDNLSNTEEVQLVGTHVDE